MSSHNILFADDDLDFHRAILEMHLSLQDDMTFDWCESPADCVKKIKNKNYDVVVLDIDFNEEIDGFSLIPKIKSLQPDCAILMHSNNDDRETILRCVSEGVDDFASKQRNEHDELLLRVKALITKKKNRKKLETETCAVIEEVGAVAMNPSTFEVFKQATVFRKSPNINVLITGPTGSGKELIAKAIGQEKNGKPFIDLNCAGISENLLEDKLFGHMKGAFTGAVSNLAGIFELADGGDIFLDEIAELSLTVQASLLRVLETKSFKRLGSTVVRTSSFRIISATHVDLEQRVREGRFREDLLARLRGAVIETRALSTRPEEIIPIVKKILDAEKASHLELSKDLAHVLQELRWPRNVRQLRECVKTMIAKVQSNIITVSELPKELLGEEKQLGVFAKEESNDIVVRIPPGTNFEDAQKHMFRDLVDHYRRKIGRKASQTSIAKCLKLSRASFQRYLKASLSISTKPHTT